MAENPEIREEISENEEEISENEEEILENEETSETLENEEILCRIRIKEETTIELDNFNLEYPFEIFRSNGTPIATIQPSNNALQEDERIISLTFRIGNRVKNKTIFRYNGLKEEIDGPRIQWPVEDYGDGHIKVRSDGKLTISIERRRNSRLSKSKFKRKRLEDKDSE